MKPLQYKVSKSEIIKRMNYGILWSGVSLTVPMAIQNIIRASSGKIYKYFFVDTNSNDVRLTFMIDNVVMEGKYDIKKCTWSLAQRVGDDRLTYSFKRRKRDTHGRYSFAT